MTRWSQVVIAAAGGLVGSTAAAAAIGRYSWNRSTAKAIEQLRSEDHLSRTEVFCSEQLDGLPDPVVRYFQFALTPGQRLIRSARLAQTGEFRTGGFNAPWSPFTAVQHVSTNPPGFVWDAAIRIAPFLSVCVRDAYIRGAGSMEGRLAALVTVVDERDRPELNAGALHRYLAEAVWFPTALLPGHGVTWQAVDNSTARATVIDSGTSVSLEFQFAKDGAIVRVSTPERFREVGGAYVATPWAGSYRDYTLVEGIRVPLKGEVEWVLPEGRLPYWRGRIVDINYDFVGV